MLANKGIFWKILAAFCFFSAAFSLCLGILIYFTAGRLAVFLVEEQARPAFAALISVEKRGRMLNDVYGIEFDAESIARDINGLFFVGKQIPARWASLADGIYFENGNFVCIQREGGIAYALAGSSAAMDSFLSEVASLLIYGGVAGLLAAALVAFGLARVLAKPLVALAARLRGAEGQVVAIPTALADRNDEIGLVARAIIRHQREERAFYEREAAFTGDASHELRTPLAALSGALEICLCQCRDAALRPHLLRMERAAVRMTMSVQAMLALARKKPAPVEKLNMADLAQAALADLQADGGNLEPRAQIDAYVCAYGRRDLALAILRNLLRNACDYGAAGSCRMLLVPGCLEIRNGRRARGDKRSGAGLGLSIAARAAAKMGWKMEIIDQANNFSASLVWPIDPPAESHAPGQAKPFAGGKAGS